MEGKTNAECARELGVSQQTLYTWAALTKEENYKDKEGNDQTRVVPANPELIEALDTKREDIIASARISLLKQAVGYEVTDEKVILLRTKNGDIIQRVERIKRHIPPIAISTFKLLAHLDKLFPRNSEGSTDGKGALAELFEKLKAEDPPNGNPPDQS
jgi:transposase-like protein